MNDQAETAMIEGAACAWPRAPRSGVGKGERWYLLQARSNAEKAISDFLGRYHYEVYYPKTLVMRHVPKRQLTPKQRGDGAMIRRPQLMAVFPTYPFVKFDITDERAHELFSVVGVYGLHCTGEKPVVVEDAYVDYLRSLEQDGVIPASTSLKDLFGIGETVRITAGPFRGFNGVIQKLPPKMQQQIDSGILSELDESMCATIAIDIFGQATPTTVQLRSIEKL